MRAPAPIQPITGTSRILLPVSVTRKIPLAPASPVPVDGWGLEIPIGSEIASVGMSDNEMAALVLQVPNGVKVWHPLFIIMLGGNFTPMIGRQFGRSFGIVQMPGAAFGVFEDGPWPTTVLEGMTPEGGAQ